VVPLTTVYESLTLLPGTSAEYGPSDFARDLYLLDRSGVSQTKGGARVSLVFKGKSGDTKDAAALTAAARA
ncbi:MAG: hypothetical protein AAB543_07700, partial [Pseudomonadota bacterium]